MGFANALKVMAEPTRMAIIELLLERHHCARSLAKTLEISDAAVSQHMALLKDAGLVSAFRHGRHIHYMLNPGAFQAMVAQFNGMLERMDAIVECHTYNPCQFKLEDGSAGCLYQDPHASEGLADGSEDSHANETKGNGMKLAIPSETNMGLMSMRSGHFGHAPYFTVVTIENDEITNVEAVKNVDHDEFGCGGVIEYAMSLGINAMLTVGMGRPPLTRFTNAGIKVYSERETPMVGAAVQRFLRGECSLMSFDDACAH